MSSPRRLIAWQAERRKGKRSKTVEAILTLVGGLIVAVGSLLLQKGMSAAAVRVVVIVACIGAGFAVYVMTNGLPTTNSLSSWAVVSMGAFGVAAGFYKWVLARPTEAEKDARALDDTPPTPPSWI